MAIDSPARIVVLGAGPVGLEAALYARFLGYEVEIFERGRVAEHVLRWGHARMFSPFGQNRSALGLAALSAQDPQWRAPAEDALLLGREWATHYLLPLSQSDLLADSIREQTEVLAIGRDGLLRDELFQQEARGEPDLRLLVRHADGERYVTADAVIDATGTFGQPNWLGPGGLPALGEREHRARIEYGLPDVLGQDRARFAGQRVLLIGSGLSAATTVLALAELAQTAANTRVTWITRTSGTANAEGQPGTLAAPIQTIEQDALPARRELVAAANRLAADKNSVVTHWPGAAVERIRWKEESRRFSVRLLNAPDEKLKADQIVANVGYRPNETLYAELQVADRYTVCESNSSADALLNPEPDFYVLGAKSYGRNSQFLFRDGLEQIRKLFTIIGDRPDLNLYATMGVARG